MGAAVGHESAQLLSASIESTIAHEFKNSLKGDRWHNGVETLGATEFSVTAVGTSGPGERWGCHFLENGVGNISWRTVGHKEISPLSL